MNEPATDKQRALMAQLKIDFPNSITKHEAIKLISDKMEKPKDITKEYDGQRGFDNNHKVSFSLSDKDILIVRQSSLKAAVEMLSILGDKAYEWSTGDKPMSFHATKIAEEFEKWVLR